MANCEWRIANSAWRVIASLILALVLLPAVSIAADGGITVVESNTSHNFAQQVTFTLRATSEAEITQVYLFFRATGLGADGLAVRWIEGHGDPPFAQAALDIVQTSVEEISAELHVQAPESIVVYIYDSQRNLEGAMILAGREWVSGQAHPELGVVVVAIPHEEGYTSRMMRDIPHEITHLLVYQAATPAGYKYVPTWLDEGLATANERWPTPEHAMVPFSPDSPTAFLSYAQSGSVVRFIRERYGDRSGASPRSHSQRAGDCVAGQSGAPGPVADLG